MDLHSYHHHQMVSTHCVSPRAHAHPEFCVKHLHLTVTRGDAVEEVRPECRCTEGVSTMFPLALPGSNTGAWCHCPSGCALSHLHEGGFPTPLLLALPHLCVFPESLPSPTFPLLLMCCRLVWMSFTQASKWSTQLLAVSDVSPSGPPPTSGHSRSLIRWRAG